jgi:PEP-CTERM motif-containing protein
MIRKYGRATAFVAIVTLALAGLSKADSLSVTLAQPTQTVLQGTTIVTFTGTILNPSSTDTVFLNADSSVTSSGLVSVDDSPFLLNPFLISLNPLQSSGSVLLFNIDLPIDLTAGLYTGAFSILGGPDGGAFSDFSDLVDVNFAVNVAPPVATPEPGTILLFAFGLAGLGLLRKRARLA